MIVGRGNYVGTSAARGSLAAIAHASLGIWVVGTLFLTGCSETKLPEEPVAAAVVPNDKVAEAIHRVLNANKADQPIAQQESERQVAEQQPGESAREGLSASEYFSWVSPDANKQEQEVEAPAVISAETTEQPTIAESQPEFTEIAEDATAQAEEVASVAPEAPASEPEYVTTPFAVLLPPQMVAAATEARAVSEQVSTPSAKTEQSAVVQAPKMEIDGLTAADQRLVDRLIHEPTEVATGVLTDARVNEKATESIREANALASRGAQYAAKQKLVEVLRMISQAKDAHEGNRVHSAALAAGLRALEEAEDFDPRGTQLEGDMDVAVIVAAHRTPIGRRLDAGDMPPRQMMDLYLRYSQVKLAIAVAGEPAGSMALYALGKVTSQIGHADKDRDRVSHRQAVAFQQGALLAHNQNYFAAHELGVLMAESGRLTEAEHLLKQVAARQPNPTVYRNLASVEKCLGREQLAADSRAMASQLAGQQSAPSGQVRWVGSESFGSSPITPTQYAGPMPPPAQPNYAGPRTAMAPQSRTPQQYGPIPPGSWR